MESILEKDKMIKTKPEEIIKFHEALMSNAPPGYIPWYFPCKRNGKDPAPDVILNIDPTSKGSWHHQNARLTVDHTIQLLKKGYNIGISARKGDPLIIIDIDNQKYLDQLPKETLTVISRKRSGCHAFCWDKDGSAKINFATGDSGEIRSDNQYVIAPGSYVPFDLTNEKEIKAFASLSDEAKKDDLLGYYTVKDNIQPREISFDGLPKFFKDAIKKDEEKQSVVKQKEEQKENKYQGKYTELFKLKVSDIIGSLPKSRIGHPLHASDTDANFSLSNDGSLGHCWRHMVSLNAVQFLCIMAGYAECQDAGTPHKGRGFSKIKGDKQAIEVAYQKAIKMGVITEKIEQVEQHKNTISLTLDNVKENVCSKLLMKKTREATELITTYILQKKHIHTTRDDEKSELWIYNEGIYLPNGRTYIKEISRKILGEGYTNHLANEVIAKIETETYIEQDKFFLVENINRIAVKNGILDLTNKRLDYFTPKEKHFNKLPVIFNENKDCPFIKQHLKTVLQDEKDLPVIQELFGYLIFREYKIEKAFMFTGSGRNGKGKTLELMKRFLGIENCSNITLQHLESDSFAMGELFNKLANLGGDISRGALKDTGTFKNLTGRDLVSAARKFKTRVNFTNYAKMIFAANELPITYDITTAFFNRWILLEFPYTFLSQKEIDCLDEKDKKNIRLADTSIIDKLSTEGELSGLLNWAIDGLHRLLKKGDFSYSHSTNEVKTKWIRKSDSAMAFLLDTIQEEYEHYIKKSELRYKYNQYCKSHKIKPASDRHLKNTLEINFGATDGRHSLDGEMSHCWEGVCFKPLDIVEEKIS